MSRDLLKLTLLLSLCLSLSGCVKMALKFAPSFIPNLTQSFFEECDPDLAEESLPAGLKIMEGLLKNDPDNRQMLTALCTAFTGYALLFVEQEDPSAASKFYLRARDYGFKALDLQNCFTGNTCLNTDSIEKQIKTIHEKDMEPLFWCTMAWNAWISLNLDKPAALGQLKIARACLEKVMEIDSNYFFGSPYILKGTMLSVLPGPFGGDAEKAKMCFDQALVLGNNKFFLGHYYFARYYAVRVQDKSLFLDLIQKVQQSSADDIPEICLINTVMQQKTVQLKKIIADLFI